ncbi:MAG: prolipoprotein diacylglyceryl transferase [Candidatus Levybacteria bacterium]|nr:prolipoprotein diacylglyceryl transferase [Candidatus Levybacteria bacterium]
MKRLNIWSILDLAAPSILLGQTIGRIGNYINQEGFGPPTSAPWGVFIDPQNRPTQYVLYTRFHPTFFYEALLDAIFFILLIYLSKRLNVSGQLFAFYLIFYSLARFITEFWRIDTATIGEIKVAHVISIFAFMIGLLLFSTRKRRG